MSKSPPIAVTRFAPSPTGKLHIGGARTALFNWAFARHLDGHFLLRIEDTDRARSSDGATVRILEDLAWLSIDWDEGPTLAVDGKTLGGDPRAVAPFQQSQRLEHYQRYLDQLLDQDLAYHAFETPDEIASLRAEARKEKHAFRYRENRSALSIPRAERFERAQAGEPHVVRFLVPDGAITVHDEALGDVVVDGAEVDDFIIRKADGFPTYHFAVVVDDELMGVTHVVRGQEHLINTPKHIILQQALGFSTPTYAHLTLIFNVDGSKMSKRDKDKAVRKACKEKNITSPPLDSIDPAEFAGWLKDKNRQLDPTALRMLAEALSVELPAIDVSDFREAGYLPEVVCNYIALLGWSPGEDLEKFDMAFLAAHFSPDRLGKTNAKFDYKKLRAFNTDAIGSMPDTEFADRWWTWCAAHAIDLLIALDAATEPSDRFRLLAGATRPRCKTFRDGAIGGAFLLTADDRVTYDEKAVNKVLLKNECDGLTTLRRFADVLIALASWTSESLHEAIESFATEHEIGMGKIAQPLRVALTGAAVSPPIDATLAILGKSSVLTRIERCLETVAADCSRSA